MSKISHKSRGFNRSMWRHSIITTGKGVAKTLDIMTDEKGMMIITGLGVGEKIEFYN